MFTQIFLLIWLWGIYSHAIHSGYQGLFRIFLIMGNIQRTKHKPTAYCCVTTGLFVTRISNFKTAIVRMQKNIGRQNLKYEECMQKRIYRDREKD